METNTNKTTATLLHLSALSQYCFPFGNFLIPIMIWSSTKEKSQYLDAQGKLVINFQLSMFLYSLILCLIAIPILLITILKNINIHEMSNQHNFILENLNFENSGGAVVVAILSILLFLSQESTMKIKSNSKKKYFFIMYLQIESLKGLNSFYYN